MKKHLSKILFGALFIISASQTRAQLAEITPMLEFDMAAITSISENGEWACGSAFNSSDGAGYQSNASKWDLKTGKRTYLVPEEDIDVAQSDAFAISNDGEFIVGQYLYQPAYYTKGKWHVLDLTEIKGYTIGEARDFVIDGNDTIIIGRIFDSDAFQKVQAVRWVNGKLEKLTEIIPREYQYDEENRMATQIVNMSADGDILLGATSPMCWPCRIPFIIRGGEFKLLSIKDRPEFKGYQADIDFFKEEKMSHNGKFIVFSFFGHNLHIPAVYDVEKDEFRILTEAPAETGGKAVDDAGNVYYAGPMTTGHDRKSYVTIDGKATQIDDILLKNYGLTQEDINSTCQDADLTGSIRFVYDVSADGKTIIGSAGYGTGGYNWVLRLKYSLFESIPDAIESIEYNNSIAFYSNNQISVIGDVDQIEVYDINGKLILSEETEAAQVSVQLNQGIYIIKLYNNDQIITNKLIVR